ncbi:MAG TPA: hypothetical protein VLG28_17300 [Acidimicrobiia bacterium]|nr:hypothetical protein [Acidimicrobiia bacterium]
MRQFMVMSLVALSLLAGACSADGAPSTDPIADLPLLATGLGQVAFGEDPDVVLDVLGALFGGPSTDTDWLESGDGIYGDCPEPLRVISWGSLTTFHTGGPQAATFFAYSYGFDFGEALAGVDSRGLNLTTPDGIGIGSTVAELEARRADVVLDGDASIDVWTFAVEPGQDPHLRGQISGISPTDTVLFIETSTGCG